MYVQLLDTERLSSHSEMFHSMLTQSVGWETDHPPCKNISSSYHSKTISGWNQKWL